jgi:hypothetical protein
MLCLEGYVGRDTDSEDEDAATRRAGYITVPSTNEVESDDDCSVKVDSVEDRPGSSKPFNTNVSPPVQKAFENVSVESILVVQFQALESANTVHLSDKDFQLPSSTNDIQLTKGILCI